MQAQIFSAVEDLDVALLDNCLKQKRSGVDAAQISLALIDAVELTTTAESEQELRSLQIIRILLNSNADVNMADEFGFRALHRAHTPRAANLILDAKADINAVNNYGCSALMMACAFGEDSVVSVLLTHRADATLRNNTGQTAMDLVGSDEPSKRCKELIGAARAGFQKSLGGSKLRDENTSGTPDPATAGFTVAQIPAPAVNREPLAAHKERKADPPLIQSHHASALSPSAMVHHHWRVDATGTLLLPVCCII